MENKINKKTDYTTLIHGGVAKDQYGAVNVPVYRSSTFIFDNVDQGARRFKGEETGYIYTRLGNPTTATLERKLAMLEHAEKAVMTASGMGAISSVMWTFLKAGDRLIADSNLYGCTFALFTHTLPKFGIDVQITDFSNIENIKKLLNDKTTMVYFETPTNPTMKVNDIRAISDLAHKYNPKIKVVVDNTFASPYLQKPLDHGANIVVHSGTKYINGHADVVVGAIAGSNEDIKLASMVGIKDCTGSVLDPGAAYLVNRGLNTLGVRMNQHCKNAEKVVAYLQKCKYVKKVNYPGLTTCIGHEAAKRQMSQFGGMASFETNLTFEQTKIFANSLKVWTLAVSLGGVESLIEHPASMTHSTYSVEELKKYNIVPNLIRISIGLEDVDELIADFEQAFNIAANNAPTDRVRIE